MDSAQKRKKLLNFILSVVILAMLIPTIAFIYKYNSRFNIKSKVQPKIVNTTTLSKITSKSHPKIFYADLEYNSELEIATQLSTNKAEGDSPYFSAETPALSDTNFVYKVEVISLKNVVLDSGWVSIRKELVKTSSGKINFRVSSSYHPEAIMYVYVPSEKKKDYTNPQLVWVGKMQ